ncbi:MAG: hypothetical protein HGA49_05025 [Eubacteriaceae bacterium]|nr:hypothetical protein [Eubacteriaceae bacterium]
MTLQNPGKEKLLIIFLSVIIISIICFYYFYSPDDRIDLAESSAAEEYGEDKTELSDDPEADTEAGKIFVHIGGEVKHPGVVELETGARLFEAIQAAGGATEKADLNQINLAAVVSDQQKILVPGQREVTEAGINPSPGSNNENTAGYPSEEGKININTASATELMNLPGVGESIAESIISYRETNNGFKTIEEIKNVNRVGDKTFEKMKDLIKIQ